MSDEMTLESCCGRDALRCDCDEVFSARREEDVEALPPVSYEALAENNRSTHANLDWCIKQRTELEAEVARLSGERDRERRRVPSNEGGPGKEEAYWLKAKLYAAITHLRDVEDYYRLHTGMPESMNQLRADRARSLYEQISDDFLNGNAKVPTMRERAEAAERERERLREALRDARADVVRVNAAGFDSTRGEIALDAIHKIDAALSAGAEQGKPKIQWEAHEGLVTVYDNTGRYVGCIGEKRWARLVDENKGAYLGDISAGTEQEGKDAPNVNRYILGVDLDA